MCSLKLIDFCLDLGVHFTIDFPSTVSCPSAVFSAKDATDMIPIATMQPTAANNLAIFDPIFLILLKVVAIMRK
jgi:hypothetical protein